MSYDLDASLLELDRILASLGDDESECKIATNPELAPFVRTVENAGAEDSKDVVTPVASLPSNTSYLGEDIETSSNPALPPRPRTQKLQVAVDAAGPLLGKPWRHQWAREKLILSFQAAEAAGGLAFTLNLSSGLQNTLSSSSDPVRLMAHYIRRECRHRLDTCPAFGFAFDVSRSGRLHLHGVVVPTVMEKEHLHSTPPARAALREHGMVARLRS